jgi:hypothetical protein
MRGAFRPLHLLTLAKALTHHLVHGGFDNTRADPLSGVVALAIVGNEAFILMVRSNFEGFQQLW